MGEEATTNLLPHLQLGDQGGSPTKTTTMAKITGEDVLLIQELAGVHDYDATSKMAGKTYKRFTYGGKCFISNDDAFSKALATGDLYAVTTEIGDDDKVAMTGFITYTRMQGLRKNQSILAAIAATDYKATAISTEEAI